MLKRIAGLVTALALTVCLLTGVAGVTASAAGEPSISVSFVNHDGTAATRLTGGSVWAVIKINNYASYIGATSIVDTVQASSFDRAVAGFSAHIDLGSSAFTYSGEWSAPYSRMRDSGSADISINGNELNVLALTDANGGLGFSISKGLLDANDGELLRIKLNVAEDVDDEIQAKLIDSIAGSKTTVSLVSKAANAQPSAVAYSKLALAIADAAELMLGNGAALEASLLVKDFDQNSWALDSWGLGSSYSGSKVTLGGSGPQSYVYSTLTYDKTADFSEGFSMSFYAIGRTYWSNYTENRNEKDISVKVGDYTFCMRDYIYPEIWYGKELLVRGDAIFKSGDAGWDDSLSYRQNMYTYINGVKIDTGEPVDSMEDRNVKLCKYNIEFNGNIFKFSKTLDGTKVFELTTTAEDTSCLEGAKLVFENDSRNGNCTTYVLNGVYKHGYSKTVTEATCTADGHYSGSKCDFCGLTPANVTIPAAHRYSLSESFAAGYIKYTCADCDAVVYERYGYSVDAINISDCSVALDKADYLYSGGAVCPSVEVKLGDKVLVNGVDYEVSYLNNTAVGTGSVVINGLGDFSGTENVSFTIWALGDVNGDNFVTAADYTLLKGYVNDKLTINSAYLRCADMDQNDVINAADVALLWNVLLKK